jgi:two-component system response regulator
MWAASDLHADEDGGPVKSKVLLVEDDESNREMLMRRLQHRGYDVVTAVDGQDALERARAESPCLILMDLSLPVIDGLTATRHLKSSPVLRGIPVIALTAHASPEDRERARAAGCDDYDTKPIEFTRLEGKMEALLRQPAARSV